MVNRSKNIGTHGESAVVTFARTHGFGNAERRALRGQLDEGDVLMCPGFILEIKAGKHAENASDLQIDKWMDESAREAANSGGYSHMLVTKRAGYGYARAGQWWAHLYLAEWMREPDGLAGMCVRLVLADALVIARLYGYGEHVAVRGAERAHTPR